MKSEKRYTFLTAIVFPLITAIIAGVLAFHYEDWFSKKADVNKSEAHTVPRDTVYHEQKPNSVAKPAQSTFNNNASVNNKGSANEQKQVDNSTHISGNGSMTVGGDHIPGGNKTVINNNK